MEIFPIVLYSAAFFGVFTSIFYILTLFEHRTEMKRPKTKKLLKTSIIVPAFNEEGRIKRTAESLLNLNYPKHLLEIILVDDGSTDNTLKEMKQYESKGVKVLTKKNGGKYTAMNYGLSKATGEIIVSLDADSFVDKNALRRMMPYFNDPEVMSVTPSMKIWKPKTILQKVQFVEYLFGIFLRKATAFLGCIHVTPGPFSAYRKSFFDKYGGYRHAHNTEDIEIALRIQSKHYEIENAPDAYSYTIGPSKFTPLFKQRLRWYYGFINNVFDYKHLFKKEYGTLGLFYLPTAFLSVFFSIFLVFYMFKTIFLEILLDVRNLNSIDFKFWKILDVKLEAFYLTPNLITTLIVFGLILAVLCILLARFISQDKNRIAYPFFLSLFLYAPLYAIWWLVAFGYKFVGKTVKWGGESWKKD